MTTDLRYRAVIFDLDGTLVDSYEALTDAVNHCLSTYSRGPLTPDQIRAFVGEGVEKLLERCFAPEEVPARAGALFEERYDEVCCSGSRMLDEVGATVRLLSSGGLRMGVCTNKPTSFSRKILEHLEVAHHFDAIVGPDLAGARKPNAAHVLFTLTALNAAPGDALFVGDMPIDVQAARNAGLDVAAIATGSSDVGSLRDASPDFFLQRFSDLLGVVGLNGRPRKA